jgi:tRNA (pseudouridine54-N1)-methyltransferase
MRTFIIVGHKATTTPDFSLEDVPGTSGRLDILCRCINAAFVLSHGIRHDVRVLLILCGGEPHKTVCLRGEDLRHLNPDERTTAALLKKALAIVAGPEWSRSTSGIFVRTGGLGEVLSDLKAKGIKPVYLREDGMDVRKGDSNLSGDAAFILGDHMGMTPEEETRILQAGAEVVSIGPASLHADHCIVLVNWMLDTGVIGDQTIIRSIS